MEKEKFEKIVKDLENRISMCEKKLDKIDSKETLLFLLRNLLGYEITAKKNNLKWIKLIMICII